jgi:prepilin-type N-terminal cleavage/methylation domain-containing protein
MQSFIEKKSKMHAMNTKPTMNNMRGFTLVELMIVVFLSAIAVIAIYRGYTAFSHSADVQEQIIEMQQNLRIGIYWLEKDLRRAGMTEEDNEACKVDGGREQAFLTATNTSAPGFIPGDPIVEFVMDLGSGGAFSGDSKDNDGDEDIDEEDEARTGDDDCDDEDERIRYSLNGEDLQRAVWDGATYTAAQTIITNVSALNFVYLNKDGGLLTSLPCPVIFCKLTTAADLEAINTVEITMVVRTTNEDYRITNNDTYANQLSTLSPWSWTPSPPDNFRRRVMSKRVKIRNANM